jgi:hypothetical protein
MAVKLQPKIVTINHFMRIFHVFFKLNFYSISEVLLSLFSLYNIRIYFLNKEIEEDTRGWKVLPYS